LGVADVAATSYTYDVSKFAAGVNTLEVWAYTAGSTNIFTGVAANTALLIDGATTQVSYTLASGLVGPSSTVNVNLNGIAPTVGTGTIGYTTGTLLLQDANALGIGTVNLQTDASVGGGVYTITTFTDPHLANLNIAGTGALVITGGITTSTIGTLNIADNDTSTGTTNLGALTANSVTNLNFTGSHAVTIGGLTDTMVSVNISNVNTGSTGVVTLGAISDTAITSLTLSGSIATSLTSTLDAAQTVSGATDNQNITLSLTGGSTSAATKTITLGNGANTVTTAGFNDVITLGSGVDSVTAGAGADRITFAAHTPGNDTVNLAAGVTAGFAAIDTGYFGFNPVLTAGNTAPLPYASNSASTSGMDIITGLVAGDKIQLTTTAVYANAANATVTTGSLVPNATSYTSLTTLTAANLTTTGLADNAIELVRGTYTASSNSFVGSSTGTDTMLVYDANATAGAVVAEAVVLVGYVANNLTGMGGASGLITLG